MMDKVKKSFQTNGKYGLIAFFIPVLIMIGVYISLGIYPGSSRSVLASDAFSQFSNFHASFNNMMHGEQSAFYTWNASLGLNYWSLISYYLGGIFTPIVFLFKNQNMPDALYVLTLLKIGAASLAFWFYSKETYRLSKWSHITLSVTYSLMSFATAQSELIMWLDTFMYLPLIILGINQIMDKGKSALLFVAYLLLFITNFYFGFMVGVFSVLYYFARLLTNKKQYIKSIIPYFITAFLAGIASMVMILPAVLDLSTNGEKLTEMTKIKTAATGFWDIIMKNMIGVFDTTKYDSIPFIYVGLLPLLFCIFYFVTNQVTLKNKLAYGGLFIILILSFYLEPLNLFWHGFHAPNMFLFRFSFLFSFLVVMLAGYGWEQFSKDNRGQMVTIVIVLAVLFSVAFFASGKEAYDYVTLQQYVVTILFLGLYLISIVFYQLKKLPKKSLALLLLLIVTGEAYINTSFMLYGILDDWNYASRSVFSDPYPDYKGLVDEANASNKQSFKRLESLAPISANDSFNYGYSGISMFSSIRNRHSSSLLNDLGFRSRGTNLNIRYQNNTLMMDSLMGIKHNISDQGIDKYGFNRVSQKGKYQLFDNKNTLPLGVLTDADIYNVTIPKGNNLKSQQNLVNHLSNLNELYYTSLTPRIIKSTNADISYKAGDYMTIKEKEGEIAKDITFEVDVPAGKQAYLSIYPENFGALKSSTATVSTDGMSYKSQIGITGQYYNLGYFKDDATVTFTVSFYGTEEVTITDPPVILLDIPKYQAAMNAISERAVDFKVSNRQATAHIETPEEQVVFTSIPFDKGWQVKVDNKKVPTKAFKDGFLTFTVPSGVHDVSMKFTPPGLIIGFICFILAIGTYIIYYYFISKNGQKKMLKR